MRLMLVEGTEAAVLMRFSILLMSKIVVEMHLSRDGMNDLSSKRPLIMPARNSLASVSVVIGAGYAPSAVHVPLKSW